MKRNHRLEILADIFYLAAMVLFLTSLFILRCNENLGNVFLFTGTAASATAATLFIIAYTIEGEQK